MSAPPPTHDSHFEGRIPVIQFGANEGIHFTAGLLCGIVAAAPFLAGFAWCAKRNGDHPALEAAGGMLLVLLAVVALMAGFVAGGMIPSWWRRKRGLPEAFSRTTQVEIGPRGLRVEGLGHTVWRDVLATESAPVRDSGVVVHTRLLGTLLLEGPKDALQPVFSHHMMHTPARDSSALTVRANVIHWPRFLAWIWFGYALAAAFAVAVLFHSPSVGVFKTLVMLCVTPFIPQFVWWIPLDQLDRCSAKRVRAFVLDGTVLRSTDGRWTADLRHRPAIHRHACGSSYDIEFLTLWSREGDRFDLVLKPDPAHHALLSKLAALNLLSGSRRLPADAN